jgi:acyl-CoA thioester hydrolase
MPADSDYSGAMWHGAFVRWLEEARVRHLAECAVNYSDLVSTHRMELVVTSLALRYAKPARLGEALELRQHLAVEKCSRVRLVTESEFRRASDGVLLASAEITCTPVNIDTGRVMRKWPDGVENAMLQVFGEDVPEFLECAARRRPRLISTAVEQSVP